jgi:hypothetical protein
MLTNWADRVQMGTGDTDEAPLLTAVEYGAALNQFTSWAIGQVAARKSPVYGAVEMFIPPDGVDEVSLDIAGQSVKSPMIHLKTEVPIDPEAVRRTDLNEIVRLIEAAANDRIEQTREAIDAYMNEATAAVGNHVTVKQWDITWDWILDQYEKVEWVEGSDGLVYPPSLHGIESLPELKSTQQDRLQAMVQRKQDEHVARRRSRRLR